MNGKSVSVIIYCIRCVGCGLQHDNLRDLGRVLAKNY